MTPSLFTVRPTAFQPERKGDSAHSTTHLMPTQVPLPSRPVVHMANTCVWVLRFPTGEYQLSFTITTENRGLQAVPPRDLHRLCAPKQEPWEMELGVPMGPCLFRAALVSPKLTFTYNWWVKHSILRPKLASKRRSCHYSPSHKLH